ncbi:hypothetical protein VNO78_32985 [Psophocarpus tetragonolobus]|uniref:Uncharacterized protein n=1 Tax=Psophocarpus tetragonolobus TaxID=3891 RepID=A0AAN9NW85_PSOTE
MTFHSLFFFNRTMTFPLWFLFNPTTAFLSSFLFDSTTVWFFFLTVRCSVLCLDLYAACHRSDFLCIDGKSASPVAADTKSAQSEHRTFHSRKYPNLLS